jgi:large subunit ribosomal protein L25
MKSVEIKCNLRKELGKKDSKKLRTQEKVPCVLYGGGENVHFWALEKDFRKVIYTPNVYLIDLNVDGKVYNAIVQDVQFHPVSDRIQHVDFIQISPDKKVAIDIPVQLNGVPVGVKEGGKLMIAMRKLKVRALPKHLPDVLEIDVTNVSLGKTVKVSDIKFPNIEPLDAKNSVIASVRLTRAARGAATEEEEAAEAAAAAAEGGEASSDEKSSESAGSES